MFTVGIDDGAYSVLALVVRCADGAEFGGASSVIPPATKACCSMKAITPSHGRRRPAFPGTCDSPLARGAVR
jgi:hypothetical protein